MKNEDLSQESLNRLRRNFLDRHRLMILSVTKICDRKCVYCRGSTQRPYDRLSESENDVFLDKRRWPEIVELCKEKDVVDILVTGGEPTLYPDLCGFAKHLEDNQLPFTLHTHGLNPRGMHFLEFCAANQLRPNIHVSSELFEDFQAELRHGILPLKFIHRAAKAGFKTELKVVLHDLFAGRENRIESQLSWWQEQGISSIRFQPAAPIDRVCSTEALLPTLEVLKSLKKDVRFADFIRNSVESFNCTYALIKGTDGWMAAAQQCMASDKIIFLTTDLKTLNCKTLWGKPVRGNCNKLFDLVCCGFQA
ncbi:hypothetical protein MSKOL_2035 [Methanosarcina sp. Kolksee]|uniref:radical SAM protein n=1 Tax=Methanosarcina sp. Kolksee TaxID=1434099 RepID=UPI00061601F7|nr:radical SAM protein [Methanosarcina sp. Kolksee]AKB47812.1 hypothetical protein MSKOL_2035 [Methanosarcina sp. Kolksee]